MLDAVGIPCCRGGVMAREEAWRGSLQTWRKRVAGWLARSNPQDLLSVDIFFDARAVHGDMRLADALMSEAHGKASRAPQFIKLLAAASPEPPAATGLFGRLKSENGRLDLKRAALLPIVSAARLLAMRYGVDRRSTPARLSGVLETGRGGAADLAAIIAGHEAVLAAILRQQIRDIHAGISPSNRVEAARLKGQELEGVKDALRAVPELNELVRDMLFLNDRYRASRYHSAEKRRPEAPSRAGRRAAGAGRCFSAPLLRSGGGRSSRGRRPARARRPG